MKSLWQLAVYLLLVPVTLFGNGEPVEVAVQCDFAGLDVIVNSLVRMDWRVLPDEMFLGFGCPVTGIWQDFYRFSYPKHECGISWEDVNGRIVFSTVVTFISKTTPRRGFVPILCAVEKPHPSLRFAPCVKDISRLYHMASPLYLEFYNAMFGTATFIHRGHNTSFSLHQE